MARPVVVGEPFVSEWRHRRGGFDLRPEPVPFEATLDLRPGRSGLSFRNDVPKPPPQFLHEPDRCTAHELRVEEVGP